MKKLFILALLVSVAALAFAQTPDTRKHPHYFGPYPNWANSPLTTINATMTLNGDGTGATAVATAVDINGGITAITVTDQGANYTTVDPNVIITGAGTGATATASCAANSGFVSSITLLTFGVDYMYPVVQIVNAAGDTTGSGATATATADPATGALTAITITNPGSGYTLPPTINVTDAGGGTGATATATISGCVITVQVTSPGSGYLRKGMRKFVDGLPGLFMAGQQLTPFGANNLGQYISVAVPDTVTYPGSDYYEIAVQEFTKQMHSDLPATGTKLRGYVQLNYGTVPSCTANDSTCNTIAPDSTPQFLGTTIIATKDRPVRILFKNMLPTGAAGNLYLPVDTTLMGSGPGPAMAMTETNNGTVFDGVRNPMCGDTWDDVLQQPKAKPMGCFTDNRATLHLHGGNTPWISDGTPHQWITPAGEVAYPDGSGRVNKGVSVSYVPDMWYDASGNTIVACAGQIACDPVAHPGATNDPGDGAQTFYYTNQQSARLLFYHDHAWGITRLNVYAGEAAGYLITDQTEQALIAPGGPLESVGLGIPLVIQDRTFVPDAAQLAEQDPTWNPSRWGGLGDFWYHHVYMPAQNPGDPTGMSAFGRWMYGPWFWPPATPQYGPIPNPYYDPLCDPNAGFCEPQLIPGTPNISVGMEQFNDTPIVNGTAYPTVTLEPKSYRFRILNAANDRFFNLQWYVADPNSQTDPNIGPTEVALKASEVAAAQADPNIVPTPDTSISPPGPSWIQIGTEGGFLPTPIVVPNQPITWITDPTRFDVGNVDQHALLVAPAERVDVVVDLSPFAGRTLILYNDAPAAFPARVACYDYYTGNPDLTPACAPTTLPGYGPNTRTIMQVKVAGTPAAAFNLANLRAAFRHNASNTGVFESGQHPIIVGQAGYNAAYGTSFVASGDCSSPSGTNACDGFARISQQGGDMFRFDTLAGPQLQIPLQPKALHDEMNATAFDEFGRMQANIGVEAVPATPAAQNVTLYPYVNPVTEFINATKLPSGASLKVTPISVANDGTQIWKITHNGVDTHPIHFHLYDVQVINRVTWDNIIIPPDLTELGWKDTVRVSPLEDTLVALRPVVPALPFELPNSIRPLNPMAPIGSMMMFNNVDPNGNPTASIVNELVNFGWEYVWHCHILSHEEMDMMRAQSLAVPPAAAPTLAVTTSGKNKNNYRVDLTWTDNSEATTGFTVQRTSDKTFTTGLVTWPLGYVKAYTDSTAAINTTYYYRVFADNAVGTTQSSGYTSSPGGNAFPTMTVQSAPSNIVGVNLPTLPVAPSNLRATILSATQIRLDWTDNANNETNFTIQRNGNPIATVGANIVTYTDNTAAANQTYTYSVAAVNAAGTSASATVTISVSAPAAPNLLSVTAARQGNSDSMTLVWSNVGTATSYNVQRATNSAFTTGLTNFNNVTTTTLANGNKQYVNTNVSRGTPGVTTYWYRVTAVNPVGASAPSNSLSVVTQ